MKRKIAFVLLGVIALFTTAIAETVVDGGTSFKLKASRDGSMYKKGEKIEFVLEATKDGKPVKDIRFWYRLSKDGIMPYVSNTGITGENGKAVIVSEGLEEAGVVRCQVELKNPETNQVLYVLAGAGVDFCSIKMSRDMPEGFENYWEEQKKILAAIPMNAEMKPVGYESQNVEVFDIKANSYKGFLTGYYARPKGAKVKSCPAIILPHGAGVRSSSMHNAISYASEGFIALDYNAHGIPNGMPDDYYKNLAKTTLKGYMSFGADNREKSFYRELYLRTLRALEFLMAQPEWDGKILIASGGSQGGCQAIVAGGLCDKLSMVVAMVPGMCDHTGLLANRVAGGPQIIKFDKFGNYNKDMLRALPYFDVANFAALLKCKSILTLGLRDNICPPSSVYAAYSNIKSEKLLIIDEEASHRVPAKTKKKCREYILDYVAKAKK